MPNLEEVVDNFIPEEMINNARSMSGAFSLSDRKMSMWKCVPDVVSLQRFLLAIMRARPSDQKNLGAL